MNAKDLLLELLASGAARFEPSTNEFCFHGMRYHHSKDWPRLVKVIGKDRIITGILDAKIKAGK